VPAGVTATTTQTIDLREPFSLNLIPGYYFNDNILLFFHLDCSNIELRFREFINANGGTTLGFERTTFGFKIKYGIGMAFFMDNKWALRLMFSYLDYPPLDAFNSHVPREYTIRSTKEQQIWLGFSYNFGGRDVDDELL